MSAITELKKHFKDVGIDEKYINEFLKHASNDVMVKEYFAIYGRMKELSEISISTHAEKELVIAEVVNLWKRFDLVRKALSLK